MGAITTNTIDKWLEHIETFLTKTTLESYDLILHQMVTVCGEPESWQQDSINKFLRWCRNQGNQESSCATKLKAIKSFLSWAGDTVPTISVPKKLSFEKKQPRAATPEEVERLLTHSLFRGHYRLALLLMADAGLRETEVRSLCWEDIAEDIKVHGKGRKLRLIPADLTPRLAATINSLRKEAGYIVPGQSGNILSRGWLNQLLAKACHDLHLPRVLTCHCLRHGFASQAALRGVHIKAIQLALGHSNLAITSRYLEGLDGGSEMIRAGFKAVENTA